MNTDKPKAISVLIFSDSACPLVERLKPAMFADWIERMLELIEITIKRAENKIQHWRMRANSWQSGIVVTCRHFLFLVRLFLASALTNFNKKIGIFQGSHIMSVEKSSSEEGVLAMPPIAEQPLKLRTKGRRPTGREWIVSAALKLASWVYGTSIYNPVYGKIKENAAYQNGVWEDECEQAIERDNILELIARCSIVVSEAAELRYHYGIAHASIVLKLATYSGIKVIKTNDAGKLSLEPINSELGKYMVIDVDSQGAVRNRSQEVTGGGCTVLGIFTYEDLNNFINETKQFWSLEKLYLKAWILSKRASSLL